MVAELPTTVFLLNRVVGARMKIWGGDEDCLYEKALIGKSNVPFEICVLQHYRQIVSKFNFNLVCVCWVLDFPEVMESVYSIRLAFSFSSCL